MTIKDIQKKIVLYFKGHFDRLIVALVLIIAIATIVFSSILFYSFALNSKLPTSQEIETKEIKIRLKEDVLKGVEQREVIDRTLQENINKLRDPFKA